MFKTLKQNKTVILFWIGLAIIHFLIRISDIYTQILDVDETQFAGFAHVLMNGGRPFVDSLDTKPLGIYWFYELCFTLFGKTNMGAVHAITACLHFLIAVLLYKMIRFKTHGFTAFAAATFFVFFSAMFLPKFTATSINSVMVFFLVLSAFLLFRAWMNQTNSSFFYKNFFASAFILGIALLFKYTAAIQFFMIPLLLFMDHEARFKFSAQQIFKSLKLSFYYGLIFCLPFILHGLYLEHLGVWNDFVHWSLMGSSQYIQNGSSTINFTQSFILRFGSFVLVQWFLWYHMQKALRFYKNEKSTVLFFTLWFALSLIPTFVGGRFYSHYFIPFIPALCGLAAIGFSLSRQGQWRPNQINWSLLKSRTLVLGVLAPSLFFLILRNNHELYLKAFPDDQIYEQQMVGEELKNKANKNESIFVWGFATGIYFYSELKPASRFLWSDLLTGRTPGPSYARKNLETQHNYENPQAWSDFFEDLENNKPDYFVDTSPAGIHGYDQFPLNRYPKLTSYLSHNYEAAFTIHDVVIYKRISKAQMLQKE